jgi:hypothetical protein
MSTAFKLRFKNQPVSKVTKEKMRQVALNRSDETKIRMIEGMKKRLPPSEETKQKISQALMGNQYNLGHHLSVETRAKIGLVHKGKPKSKETKMKMSISAINRSTDPEYKRRQSDSQKERCRLNPMSIEQRLLISKSRTGTKASQETKDKMSKQRKGHLPWNKGKHIHSEETIEQYRQQGTNRWANMSDEYRQSHMLKMHLASRKVLGYHKSKPQKELFELLKQIFKDAEWEYLIKTKQTWRFADIAVPSLKIAFEYDGDHWHEKHKEDDKRRDSELAEMGWATFRVNSAALKILARQKIFTLMRNLN